MRAILWLGSAAAAVALSAVAAIGLHDIHPSATTSQTAALPQAAAPAQPAPSRTAAAAQPAAAPSFDVVSVAPGGQAVIAGRAEPGDRVRVLDGGKQVGEVAADRRGEWALVPSAPLPAGQHQLSLEAIGRDGGAPRKSGDTVALSVAPPAAAAPAAASTTALLLPGEANRPAQVLQGPGGDGRALSLDAVEHAAGDRLILSGRADPGARLSIHAGPALLGTAAADSAGKWSLVTRGAAGARGGLQIAELGADGAILRSVAATLDAGRPPAGPGTYVVARGNSLWVIAQRVYGSGLRYTEIFHANRREIRDPDLIYPGQHFTLPRS